MIKNYLYNASYQILLLLLPFITVPYVTRVLGDEALGTYAFSISITQYFILFSALGVQMYGSRAVARARDSREALSKTFLEIYKLQLMSSALTFVVYGLIFFREGNAIYFAQSLYLIGIMFDITWLYVGVEDFRKIAIRNGIIKFVSVIGIFTLVKSPDDLLLYTVILSLSVAAGQMVMFWGIKKQVDFVPTKMTDSFKHLFPVLVLFIPPLSIGVYTFLDKFFLGTLTDSLSDVAIYDTGQKVIRMVLAVVAALSMVVMPRVANQLASNDIDAARRNLEKSFQFVSIIGFAFGFGLIAIAKEFVPWFFGDEFIGVIDVFYFSALLIIPVGVSNVFGFQYLVAVGQQKKYAISTIVAAVASISLNLLLIPIYGYIGASITILLVESIGALLLVYFSRDFFNLKKMFKPYGWLLIASLLMVLVDRMIGTWLGVGVFTTSIQVLIGAAVYLTFLTMVRVIDSKEVYTMAKSVVKR